ncbi:pyridoxamine 5'-phosphate oxidase [Petrimonas sulfuriphila]|jgi:pyridoxamine 5'-phosphate oxidase|uniref:pyridoxamine 5'-phosphate oxidase n=1 Tax=Petrimonas TaxID=307628 RepID=UPI0030CC06A0
MKKLFDFREEYKTGELNESGVKANPMEQFQLWLQAAIDSKIPEPNAMTIATCTANGKPSARVVLLKEINKSGFVFFTNYLSRKGRELLENPFAALVFDWHSIERQVRVEGRVERLPVHDSDTYFNERPREAQIGAWSSQQSKILNNREELEQRQVSFEEKFNNRKIFRPSNWGGFILLPATIEFWQGRPGRLHDRLVYLRTEEGWTLHRLAP